jgi:hypothetical protein
MLGRTNVSLPVCSFNNAPPWAAFVPQFCGGNGRQQDTPTITFNKRYAWVIAAVVIVLLMFYFGGFALFSFAYQLIRFLIPVGIIILIGMGIYLVGREQGFWE